MKKTLDQLKIRKSRTPLMQNMTGAICLTFVQIFSYFCICVIGAIAAIFLTSLFKSIGITQTVFVSNIIGAALTALLCLLLLSPLKLSIKGWYRRLDNDFIPLNLAFSGFTTFKRYRTSVLFCLVRGVIIFLLFFLPMLPSIFLIGFVRGFFAAKGLIGITELIVAIAAILLFVLGIIFSSYHAISFFYIDYLFLAGKVKNPIAAFIASKKLAKANKHELISTLIGVSPYMALCVLIFPAFFAIPKIQSDLAQHAKSIVYGHERIQGTYIYNRAGKDLT